MKLFAWPAVLTLLATLVACGDTSTSASSDTSGSAAAAWQLSDEPADAVDVRQAKTSAQEGDAVVVRGRVGGRVQPVSDDGTVFTVMDLSVTHCWQMGDEDHCPTPWDYCCELPEDITANAATVQLVDAEGRPLSVGAGDQVEPLDEVVLVATVAPRPTPDVLVLRTTGVYRTERPSAP